MESLDRNGDIKSHQSKCPRSHRGDSNNHELTLWSVTRITWTRGAHPSRGSDREGQSLQALIKEDPDAQRDVSIVDLLVILATEGVAIIAVAWVWYELVVQWAGATGRM
jgi:hypothetical protein